MVLSKSINLTFGLLRNALHVDRLFVNHLPTYITCRIICWRGTKEKRLSGINGGVVVKRTRWRHECVSVRAKSHRLRTRRVRAGGMLLDADRLRSHDDFLRDERCIRCDRWCVFVVRIARRVIYLQATLRAYLISHRALAPCSISSPID